MSTIEDARPPSDIEREDGLLRVLQHLWTYALTTKSDTARNFADEIAEAASRGFITTQVAFGDDLCGRLWKITVAGLQFLSEHGSRIAPEQVANYRESYINAQV